MRKAFAGVAVGVLSTWVVLTALAAPNAGTAPATAGSAADVRKLLEERRDVLTTLVEIRQGLYRNALAPLDSFLRARKELLGAELDLASTPQERVAAYESLLQNAEQMEQTVKAQKEAGQSSEDKVLECRAERLKAQADLMTERLKMDEKSK